MTLIARGMNILEVETFIIERRWETHAREQTTRSLYESATHNVDEINDGEDEFTDSGFAKTPSNDLIVPCKFFV